jgi:CBS domain-containing protein
MPDATRGVPVSGGEAAISLFLADQVATVPASATLLEAAEELVADEVGLLVVGSQDDVRGVISERDIVRAVGGGRDPAQTPVMDVAHTGLVWCPVTATVREAALLMMTEYVRHVLVEDDEELVGIVSARDLLGAFVSEPT